MRPVRTVLLAIRHATRVWLASTTVTRTRLRRAYRAKWARSGWLALAAQSVELIS
eukprot:COSAG01_NODE_58892_length_303_cov_0.936275_2_plen_54_part_01